MSSREHSLGARPGAAIRLIFAFDGDDVRLLSRRRVEMTLPPGDDLEQPREAEGFWAELRRDDGEVLDARRIPHPLRRDTEVFSDDPERSVSRAPDERTEGAFTVVVPDHPEGDHVALLAGEAPLPGDEATRAAAGPREVAVVPLRPRPNQDES